MDKILCSVTLRECERRARRSGMGQLGDEFAHMAQVIEQQREDARRPIYFFGCWNNDKGYYFHRTDSTTVPWQDRHLIPFVKKIDGVYAPAGKQIEGRACLRHLRGWTVLAWWDRSVDTRSNSNAALVVEGEFEFEDMLVMLKNRFPRVFARFDYSISLYLGRTTAEDEGRR